MDDNGFADRQAARVAAREAMRAAYAGRYDYSSGNSSDIYRTEDECRFIRERVGRRYRLHGNWEPTTTRERIARLRRYAGLIEVRTWGGHVDVPTVRREIWSLIEELEAGNGNAA